jgi:hypothetical protein
MTVINGATLTTFAVSPDGSTVSINVSDEDSKPGIARLTRGMPAGVDHEFAGDDAAGATAPIPRSQPWNAERSGNAVP